MMSSLAHPASIVLLLLFFCSGTAMSAQEGTKTPEILEIDARKAVQMAKYNAFELKQKARRKSIDDQAFQLRFWRSLLPKLDFRYSGRDSVTYNAPDSYSKEISLSLSLPVYQGGKLQRERKAYLAQSLLQALELESGYKELEARAWLGFYKTLLSRQEYDLSVQAQKISSKDYQISLKKHSIGAITTLALTDIEIEFIKMKIRAQEAENKYKKSQKELRKLLQIPEGIDFRLNSEPITAEALPSPQVLEKLQDYLHSELLGNNLALKKLDQQIFQANMQLRDLKLRFVPQISLNSSLSFSGKNFPLRDFQFSFGLSLSLKDVGSPASLNSSLSAGNQKNRSRSLNGSVSVLQDLSVPLTVRGKEMELETLYKKRNMLDSELKNSVQEILTEYRQLYQKMDLSERVLTLSRTKEDISQLQYQKGLLDQIKLLQARRETYARLLERNKYIIETQEFIYRFSISLNQNITEFLQRLKLLESESED